METWDAIRARRNVRSYTEEPIAPEKLDRILEAARRTPSARNWQPWDFVVVTDREQLVELATVWVGAGHVAGSASLICSSRSSRARYSTESILLVRFSDSYKLDQRIITAPHWHDPGKDRRRSRRPAARPLICAD